MADDDRLLPQFLLRTRWSRPEDDARAAAATERVAVAIEGAASSPVDLDGLELTRPFIDALGAAAAQIVRTDVQMLARIERLLAELGPSAILLAQEGIRTPLAHGRPGGGDPLIAVQHGAVRRASRVPQQAAPSAPPPDAHVHVWRIRTGGAARSRL